MNDFFNPSENPQTTTSSTPAGSPQVTPSASSPQFASGSTTDTTNAASQNDTVDSIVLQLTSGVTLPDNSPTQTPSGENQTDNPSNRGGEETTDTPLDRIMQSFGKSRLIDDVDTDKFRTAMEDGADVSVIENFVDEVGNGAVRRAVSATLDLIPEIARHVRESVLKEVNANNAENQQWNDFVNVHPEYAQHEKLVREQLENGLKGGADKKVVYEAIDLIFGNLKGEQKPDANSGEARVQRGSQAFSLDDYTG